MTTLVTILHVLVSFVLIVVILLQAGKGGGMGAAFGGGGSGSVFGGRGATTFLSKVTSACALIFMITSLTLSYLATRSTSVVRSEGSVPASSQQQVPPSPIAPPGQGAPAQGTAPAQQNPAAPAPATPAK
ncbi:MAG TPA: preprotein translocase subunit SecG [Anaeromyxobacteraceae bacterium]|nr:preprotein translocase subunit SecG [Anaeromyxobacteraceae bacterium]